MKRLTTYGWLGTAAFAMALTLGADGVQPAHAAPPIDQVAVVNTPTVNVATMPPVTVSGNVTLANGASVNVSGGNVGVSGNVGLVAGTTVLADPSQTVGVSAAPAGGGFGGSNVGGKTAIVVKNADDAQRPFAEECLISQPAAGGVSLQFGLTTDAIPPGKRAVIEYASANCTLTHGQLITLEISGLSPSWQSPQVLWTLDLVPTLLSAPNASDPFENVYVAGQPVRAYLEPQTQLECHMLVAAPEGAFCSVTVTGYLVDTP